MLTRHRRLPWYTNDLLWGMAWGLVLGIIGVWGIFTLIFFRDSITNLAVLALAILVTMCLLGIQTSIDMSQYRGSRYDFK